MNADPLGRFEAEHLEALGELDRMEEAVVRLQQGGDGAGGAVPILREGLGFVSGAVRRHNENEERALFSLLAAAQAPIGPFEEEHAELRRLERELQAALERGDAGRTTRAALALIDLLRDHIRREDRVLFPLARTLLGSDGLREVARRLEEADAEG